MSQPIEYIAPDDPNRDLEPGIGLCLSGGGYRAMLFHVGVLWRLNETGVLKDVKRISSVSGGSITAAVLGLNWTKLNFGVSGVSPRFDDLVVQPIRRMGRKTIDRSAILFGGPLPGTISDRIVKAYRKHLFGDATLQDLPDDPPRFVINATNVQSGALWRFMKPYMRDWRVGEIKKPDLDLATAVAASSAFPPFLSPVTLEFEDSDYTPATGDDLQVEPFTTDVVLTDGGVYDNLGLETVWKRYETVLVSDAGGKMHPDADPKLDWVRHTRRVMDVVDNQVRSLRKRQLISSYKDGNHCGAYWGIRSHIADYKLPDSLPCPSDKTLKIANIPTRLKRLSDYDQERLINWGYAISDTAIRKHFEPTLPKPDDFPYPDVGVG